MRPHGETGVQSHVNSFLKYLSDNGANASLITPFSATAFVVYPIFALRKLIDPLSGNASVWWYRHWHYVFLRWKLSDALRDGSPITIYAQCTLSAKAALRARKGQQQPVVMVAHMNVSEGDEWAAKGRIRRGGIMDLAIKRLERSILPKLDGLVYVSRFMRETLLQQIPPIRAVRSIVISNFVAEPSARSPASPPADIITIGTLEPRKNQSYLVQVLAAAKSMGRTYTMSIVGRGPERQRLESLSKSLGVSEQIRFLGFQPKAAELIPGHRVYCHGATMENLPITFLEAMAHGLPIFAAPVGGIPEIFSDGVEGHYWSLDKPVEGAQMLISVLDNELRYRALSDAALKKFRQFYEQSKVGRQLEEFLCSMQQ